MAERTTAPYGSWRSPITTELITAKSITLGQVALDGVDVYWVEGRPEEEGRNVVVRRTPDGRIADVSPPPFNARTRVHEYGGGAISIADGVVYFSNYADQRLYRQPLGAAPEPISPPVDLRYADGDVDRGRGRLICVREDHTDPSREAVNTIVGVDLARGGAGQVLVTGNDFYAWPRLSPDGQRLAWVTWTHPNLPWDDTELWVGALGPDGGISSAEHVAGGPGESIFQPQWSPDGTLYFISDRSGWWNLYRWRAGRVEPVLLVEAELATAAWTLGLSTYAFLGDGRLACSYSQHGRRRLAIVDPTTGQTSEIELPYGEVRGLHAHGQRVVFIGGTPGEAAAVIAVDLPGGQVTVLRRSSESAVDPAYLSRPEPIEFPTESGLSAHAYYYPPQNPDYVAPPGERPPLVVRIHGGPTSSTSTTLSLEEQYWTSRGFAFLDVNYGGSTGYGRAYRQRLNGQWGVVDVNDAVNGARYLVEQGLVDPNRLAIRGTSAGGYTTLTVTAQRDVFQAGAAYFGISDLEVWAGDTHKFESRYLDNLIGPYPERRDLYQARSASHFLDRVSAPLLVLQGLEDKIVPPNQAKIVVEGLRARKKPVAYLAFEGEQHGFRRAATIQRALTAELSFYSQVFGIPLSQPIELLHIENFPGGRA
jgi:dipeptidyl aminopeptidase/acylaminoacyl peptidase